MTMTTINIANLLEQVLKDRKQKNGGYSLRAFARDLGIKPGPLSEMMTGKRAVSPTTANLISRRLGLSQTDAKAVQGLATDGRRKDVKTHNKVTGSEISFTTVPDDHFAIIADWEHYAILSLIKTDDFDADAAWIARRIGIAKRTAELALKRLVKLGYIKKSGQTYTRLAARYHTSNDIPSAALREGNRQNINQALACLETTPVELRDITSMTLALCIDRIPQAKKLIHEFRWKFLELMEKGPKTEVYNLNIQFCPVTHVRTD